ncbi:MAG: hypothetical protein PUG48_10535 [Clostridia bacterium]|nr:hypothetical protein [Clostridia bacterium]
MVATRRKYAIAVFTSVFAIVVLLFSLNISNINASAAVTAPDSVSVSVKHNNQTVSEVAWSNVVTIKAAASGGSGGSNRHYEYSYSYKFPGTSSSILIQSWTTSSSCDFYVTQSGVYTFTVNARVSDDTSDSPSVTKTINLKVVGVENTSTIDKSNIELGDSISINASASGGSSYLFKYEHYLGKDSNGNDKWEYISPSTSSSPYTKTSVIAYEPTTPGKHYFKVTAKDNATGAVSDYKQFSVDVKNKTYPTLVNNSTLDAYKVELETITQDDGTIATKVDSITATAQASGGSGTYKYKFEVCDEDGNRLSSASALQDFSNKDTFKFSPSGVNGKYMIKVTVKDTKTNKTAIKKLFFVVEDKLYDMLILNSNINETTINTPNNSSGRDTLKIEASASGGSGGYQYQYTYIKDGGTEETFGQNPEICESQYAGGMQENATFTAKLLKPGKYKIIVYVFDNRNVHVRRVHNITVNQAPKFTKGELDTLITRVNGWYNRLTPSQQKVFMALTEISSKDNFKYANWKKALEKAQEVLNSGSEYDVDAVYEELTKQQDLAESQDVIASEASSILFSVSSSLSNLLEWLLTGIGNLLKQGFGESSDTSVFKGFDIKGFVDTYSPIFMIFANALLVLLFGVNVISSAVQYELFTLKGAVRTLGHLFLAKIWIDLSCTICLSVIDIGGSLLSQIIDKAQNILQHIEFSFTFTYHSDIWLIGQIIDFIVMAMVLVIIFLMFIPLLFFLVKVIVKLFIMNFELAALSAMSPAFFACLVGEETKQYFKNFVMTFLSVIVEVIFMGIVYAAFINWYSGFGDLSSAMDLSNLDIGSQIEKFAIFTIVFIAACSLMIKPPQVFKNLIK